MFPLKNLARKGLIDNGVCQEAPSNTHTSLLINFRKVSINAVANIANVYGDMKNCWISCHGL